ncbi:MAG TPA: hypothetical protein VNO17_01585 [Actinomycetota bacterium]|nr:hypothetical protein [Actinomycetota bacterium]
MQPPRTPEDLDRQRLDLLETIDDARARAWRGFREACVRGDGPAIRRWKALIDRAEELDDDVHRALFGGELFPGRR